MVAPFLMRTPLGQATLCPWKTTLHPWASSLSSWDSPVHGEISPVVAHLPSGLMFQEAGAWQIRLSMASALSTE